MVDVLPRNLERKDLDFKCPRKIRDSIAEKIIDEWYLVGRDLDVSDTKLKSIRALDATAENKAVAVLDAWAEEHGGAATCLKLVDALHRRKKTSTIEILCDKVIQETTTSVVSIVGAAVKPSDNQKQEEGHHIINPDVEVVSRRKELESRFRLLHKNIKSELESKKVTVRELLDSLTFLPFDLEQEYKQKISEMLPDLRREEEVSDLFLYLNPLVSFLDYGLTEYLIKEFGGNTLKKIMNEYSEDVDNFMKKTTVEKIIDNWPGPQKIPPNYSMLIVTINENPKTYTLYGVDQLRKQYCSELKMTEIFFKMIGLKMSNSFIIEWLVPSALVLQLIESARKIDSEFCLHKHILKVVVGDKQIFPFLPDSEPDVPTLQTPAATVKMADIGDRKQKGLQLATVHDIQQRKQASEDFMYRIYGALEKWHATQQGGDEKRVWITEQTIRAFIECNVNFEDITSDDNIEVSYTASMNSKAVIAVAQQGAVGRASVGGGAGGAALGVVGGAGAGAVVGALIGIIGGPIGVAIGAGIGAGVGAATGGVGANIPGTGVRGPLAYKFAKKVDVKIISLKDHFNAKKFIEQSQRIKITCQFLPQEDA